MQRIIMNKEYDNKIWMDNALVGSKMYSCRSEKLASLNNRRMPKKRALLVAHG